MACDWSQVPYNAFITLDAGCDLPGALEVANNVDSERDKLLRICRVTNSAKRDLGVQHA